MKLNRLLFLTITAIFSLSTMLNGQVWVDEYEGAPMFGIKGGVNIANLSTDEGMGDENTRTGFHVGIFYDIPLSATLSFRPEVLYSTKGSELTYDQDFLGIDITSGESSFNLNYIDVPLYLVFKPTPAFNIFVGPYASYLVNADIETDTELLGFLDISEGEELDRDHFNSMDFGVSAGIGFVFGNVSLGANYAMGLTQVAREDDVSEALLEDAKNRVIQVSLGLMF